jgi:hypothetical protein
MTCGSCGYYQPDYGMWTATGWTKDGSDGRCLLEPKTVQVRADRTACMYWKER